MDDPGESGAHPNGPMTESKESGAVIIADFMLDMQVHEFTLERDDAGDWSLSLHGFTITEEGADDADLIDVSGTLSNGRSLTSSGPLRGSSATAGTSFTPAISWRCSESRVTPRSHHSRAYSTPRTGNRDPTPSADEACNARRRLATECASHSRRFIAWPEAIRIRDMLLLAKWASLRDIAGSGAANRSASDLSSSTILRSSGSPLA